MSGPQTARDLALATMHVLGETWREQSRALAEGERFRLVEDLDGRDDAVTPSELLTAFANGAGMDDGQPVVTGGTIMAALEASNQAKSVRLPEPHEPLVRRVAAALDLILRYSGIEGHHHQAWVHDQVTLALTGDVYGEFVDYACNGPDGPETYAWDKGVAP